MTKCFITAKYTNKCKDRLNSEFLFDSATDDHTRVSKCIAVWDCRPTCDAASGPQQMYTHRLQLQENQLWSFLQCFDNDMIKGF